MVINRLIVRAEKCECDLQQLHLLFSRFKKTFTGYFEIRNVRYTRDNVVTLRWENFTSQHTVCICLSMSTQGYHEIKTLIDVSTLTGSNIKRVRTTSSSKMDLTESGLNKG